MKKLRENWAALSLLLTIPLLQIFYQVLNNAKRPVHSLVTEFDLGLPFLKIFVLPYIGWYLFIIGVLVYLCIKDKEIYYKTLLAYDIGLLISYAIFYFYQTTVPRPELVGNDFLTMLTRFVYATDQPFNCFPSIHVLSSYLMVKAISNSRIRNTLNVSVISLSSAVIVFSTFFIKQHVIFDAVAAIFIGEFVFNYVYYLEMERIYLWNKIPSLLLMMKKKLEIY